MKDKQCLRPAKTGLNMQFSGEAEGKDGLKPQQNKNPKRIEQDSFWVQNTMTFFGPADLPFRPPHSFRWLFKDK